MSHPFHVPDGYPTIADDMNRIGKPERGSDRLRILVVSPFFPNVGGIETVFSLLVREWEAEGHEVRVIHPEAACDHASGLLPPKTPIYHAPSSAITAELHRWCDIVVHGSLNTRYLAALIFSGKPCIVTQHGSVTATGLAPLSKVQRIKRWISRRFPNITCSQFVADELGVHPLATGNPYQDDVFRIGDEVRREKELIFVGRLVTDKGLPLLLRALHSLHEQGIHPKLSVVGTGPELSHCQALVQEFGLNNEVTFLGVMQPMGVAEHLRRHQILVVPSAFREPFGIVALEGIACGCKVVASGAGGMSESVGSCGIFFENNSLEGLVDALKQSLAQAPVDAAVRERHLAPFRASKVAAAYMVAMRSVISQHQARQPWWKRWLHSQPRS